MKPATEVNGFLKCLSCGTYMTSPSFAVIRKHFEKCQLKKTRISSTARHPADNDRFENDFDDFIDNKTETVTFTQPSLVVQRYNLKRLRIKVTESEPELEENRDDDDSKVPVPSNDNFPKTENCQNEIQKRSPKLSRLKNIKKEIADNMTAKKSSPVSRVKRNEAWKLGFSLMMHKSTRNSPSQISADHPPKHSTVQCPYNCSTQLNSAKELISHFKSAHPDKFSNVLPNKKTRKITTIQSGEIITDKLGCKRQKCEDCGRFYLTQYLARHRAVMHPNGVVKPENTFTCAYPGCNVKLKADLTLKNHFVVFHLQNSPYACNFPGCNIKRSSPCSLRKHMEQQHFELPPTCSKCGVTYTNQRRLKVHRCEANVKKMQSVGYKLVEIDGFWKIKLKSFIHIKAPVKSGLSSELSDTPNVGMHNLDKANQYIDSLKQIDINAMIRSDPGFIQVCKNCPGFDKVLFGAERRLGSKRPNVYNCSKCPKILTSIRSLYKHFAQCKRSDGDTSGTFKKTISHSKGYFESAKALTKVIGDKHGSKRHKCDKCGRFFRRCYLPTHKATMHPNGTDKTNPKPDNRYSCAYPNCKTKCENASRLKRHFILHLEKNPYACTAPGCYYKCNVLWRLKQHMLLHYEASQICNRCGVTCPNADRLSKHKCEANIKKLQSGDYKLVEIGGFWRVKPIESINSASDSQLVSAASVDKMDLVEVNRVIESLTDIDIDAIIRSDPGFIQACKDVPGFGELLLGKQRFFEKSQPGTKKRSKIYKCSRCPTRFTGLHGFMEHNKNCRRNYRDAGEDLIKMKTNFDLLKCTDNDEEKMGVIRVKIEPELIVPDDVVNEGETSDFHDNDIYVKHESN